MMLWSVDERNRQIVSENRKFGLFKKEIQKCCDFEEATKLDNLKIIEFANYPNYELNVNDKICSLEH